MHTILYFTTLTRTMPLLVPRPSHALPSQYTVYTRDDPFPRINVAIGPIAHMEEWTLQHQFYAFDIALAGTCLLTLQHCVRSIYNAASNVSRHRLTTEDPRLPWEFRMHIYVFPAEVRVSVRVVYVCFMSAPASSVRCSVSHAPSMLTATPRPAARGLLAD